MFYCHGCGSGGGLARLIRWWEEPQRPIAANLSHDRLLDRTYSFYRRQLTDSQAARAYLAGRGMRHHPPRRRNDLARTQMTA